jgi:hypothetical protein
MNTSFIEMVKNIVTQIYPELLQMFNDRKQVDWKVEISTAIDEKFMGLFNSLKIDVSDELNDFKKELISSFEFIDFNAIAVEQINDKLKQDEVIETILSYFEQNVALKLEQYQTYIDSAYNKTVEYMQELQEKHNLLDEKIEDFETKKSDFEDMYNQIKDDVEFNNRLQELKEQQNLCELSITINQLQNEIGGCY